MFLTRWLRKSHHTPQARPATHQSRFRPAVEGLEAREVPAVLTVTTTADVIDPNDGVLSLREAVIAANAASGSSTINLPAGTYTLTRTGLGEDAGLTGDLDLAGKVTIRGAGAGATVVTASAPQWDQRDRLFHVLPGADATLSGLTVRGGGYYQVLPSGEYDRVTVALEYGGGVLNQGNLTASGCRITDNAANLGGGIANFGTLQLGDSSVSGNSADVGGGLANGGFGNFVRASATVRNCALSVNTAGSGGGISNIMQSAITILDSTIGGNAAAFSGGGIYTSDEPFTGDAVRMNGCTLTGNSAGYQGGGIYAVYSSVRLGNSTLSDNAAASEGGAVYFHGYVNTFSLTVRGCTLSGNSAGGWGGGAIYLDEGAASVSDSTLSGNSTSGDGGAILTVAADLQVKNTTITGNTAGGGGGGILNAGSLRIASSTVTGNTAPSGADILSGWSLLITDSTVGVVDVI